MALTDTIRPAANAAGRPVSPRRKVRMPWLLAAAGLFLLAVMLVLWAVSTASDRTEVLTITEPVRAGEQIPDSAIGTVGISNDAGFGRIYLASQRSELVGAVAVADLSPGDLLGPSMVTGEPDTFDGERLVGAVLRAGRYPEEIQRGDTGLAVSTVDRAAESPGAVPIRVVSVSISETAEASITFAVGEVDAAQVATWSGTDELVVIIQPLGADE